MFIEWPLSRRWCSRPVFLNVFDGTFAPKPPRDLINADSRPHCRPTNPESQGTGIDLSFISTFKNHCNRAVVLKLESTLLKQSTGPYSGVLYSLGLG